MKTKERGITLIALVVTIIVLLILAGVSIAMITGQSGILSQAGTARDKSERANIIEDAQRDLLDEMTKQETEVTESMLKGILDKYFLNVPEKLPDDLSTVVLTSRDGKYNDILASEVYKGTFGAQTGNREYPVEITTEPQPGEIFDYDINDDGTITITGIKSKYADVYYYDLNNGNFKVIDEFVIPNKIDGHKVTKIMWGINPCCAVKLVIPNSVVYFESNVNGDGSWSASCLKEVFLSKSLVGIGKWAFYECEQLKKITIPDGVTEIGSCAFENSGLTEIKLPLQLTTIETRLFNGCEGLEEVTIGSNVKKINTFAFKGCNSLKKVNYEGTPEQWEELINTMGSENNILKAVTVNYNYKY